jgi:hypothetical protein
MPSSYPQKARIRSLIQNNSYVTKENPSFFTMCPTMSFLIATKGEIFYSIIHFDTMNMVDYFTLFKFPAKHPFHVLAVNGNIKWPSVNKFIPAAMPNSTFPIMVFFTRT